MPRKQGTGFGRRARGGEARSWMVIGREAWEAPKALGNPLRSETGRWRRRAGRPRPRSPPRVFRLAPPTLHHLPRAICVAARAASRPSFYASRHLHATTRTPSALVLCAHHLRTPAASRGQPFVVAHRFCWALVLRGSCIAQRLNTITIGTLT